MSTFTEMERYSRHYNLPGFTKETQNELGKKNIAIIGIGGLGSPVLQYLCAAGIGTIHIIDHDKVSLSNLQRQIIFNENDIGKDKARMANEKMNLLNSEVSIHSYTSKLDEKSISVLLNKELDLIIDASDNFSTRYLVDSFSKQNEIPLIYGAIHRYEGQMCVFNYQGGSSYRDLFPSPPEDGTVDNCDINGVLGPVAGMIGSLMANEALKVLTGIGKVQADELVVISFDDLSMHKMKIPKGAEQIDIKPNKAKVYHSISAYDLRKAIDEKERIHMIDIRQDYEFEQNNVPGSVNIPSHEILERLNEIPIDKGVVVICNIGQSSMNVIRYLQNELDYKNLINLDGGVYGFFRES